MASALNGIKILDLTGMGPSSFAAGMLADMGADVIKIGTPPGASDKGVGAGIDFIEGMDSSAFFDTPRNKRNIGINFKSEVGKKLFFQLVEKADVVLEAFRPGVMDRLEIGYDTASRKNPRIIYCAVSGYGQTGPYRDFPGHDANYAAMGGALGLIGYSADDPPVMAENIIADMTTAVLQAVVGILVAIIAREKTGRGQLVDIAMTDGTLFMLSCIPEIGEYLMNGTVPQRGNTLFGGSQPCYAVYETKDGKYISLGTLEPHFWKRMCKTINRKDFIAKQYAPSPVKEEVFQELQNIFKTRTRDEWFEVLVEADVPVGKVLDIHETFTDPHMQYREMLIEVDHPRWGKSKQIGFPIKFSDTPWELRIPAAKLGDHTNEVLSKLGYSEEEIEKLKQERVIC